MDECDSDEDDEGGDVISQPCDYSDLLLLKRKGLMALRGRSALEGRGLSRVTLSGVLEKHGTKSQT